MPTSNEAPSPSPQILSEIASGIVDSVEGNWSEISFRMEFIFRDEGKLDAAEITMMVTPRVGKTYREFASNDVLDVIDDMRESLPNSNRLLWTEMNLHLVRDENDEVTFKYNFSYPD